MVKAGTVMVRAPVTAGMKNGSGSGTGAACTRVKHTRAHARAEVWKSYDINL